MSSLPLFKSDDLQFMLHQTKWKAALDPVLSSPLPQGSLIEGVSLISGTNTINHLLGRMMQGWFIVDIDSGALVYRSQPFNKLTLTLTSSAPAHCAIWVF